MSTNLISRPNAERPVPTTATQNRYNLSLGGELAGGEVFAILNAFGGQPIAHRNQLYQWRYVDNDQSTIRQFSLGRINTQSTCTIFAPVVGMQLTSASTLRRKSFGSKKISKHTHPEWLAEKDLYFSKFLKAMSR